MQVNSADSDQDAVPESSDEEGSSAPESSNEEEDFPTVPIDDEHWTTEMVSERTFAYMKMGYPTMYVNTHALMEIIMLPHIWTA